MVLPELIQLINTHAEELSEELLAGLQRDPRTQYLRGVGPEEFRRRALDLYTNLSSWVAGRREAEIAGAYEELGAARRRDGVSASELVWALLLAKRHLLDFIRRNDAADTSIELYQKAELMEMVERFFESAVYHALRGHEGLKGVASAAGAVRHEGVWCD